MRKLGQCKMKFFWRLKRDFKRLFHCIHLQLFPNDLTNLGFQRFLVFLKKAKYDRLSTFLSIAIIDGLCDRRVTLFFHDGQITIVDLLGLISTFTLTQSSCIHLQQFPNSQKKLGISKVSGFPEKGKIRQVIDRANMTRAKTLSQIARLCPLCSDEEAIYDIVSEDQYAEIVNDRLKDEFIVGDIKGSGYADTGREIFDEEQADWSEEYGPRDGKKKKKSHVKAPGSGNIAHLLSKNKGNPQKEIKSLGTDSLLDELLTGLDKPNISAAHTIKPSFRPAPSSVQSSSSIRPSKQQPIRPAPTKILQKKVAPKQVKTEVVDMMDDLPDIPFQSSTPAAEEPKFVPPPAEDSMDAALDDFDDVTIQNISIEAPKVKVEPKEEEPKPKLEPVFSTFSNSTFVDQPDAKTTTDSAATFDKTNCPKVTVDGVEMLSMYYLDIYENPFHNPGTVYLVGKVEVSPGKFTSATVAVQKVPRNVFVLPRDTHRDTGEEVKMVDVYNEFDNEIAPRFKIEKFQSKPSTKKFAWSCKGVDVPFESEYLEVRYAADLKPLPHDLEGKTFSRVFGANQSALESFILQKKLKGPSWINVKNAVKPRHHSTWSTFELSVESVNDVIIDAEEKPPPPLTVISLSLKTMLNPKTHANEIVSIAGLVQSKFHVDKTSPKPVYEHHFAAISPTNNLVYPYDFEKVAKESGTNIEVFKNERSMLGWFVAKFQRIDPDIIVGYDSIFDIDVLLHRLVAVKIPHWSRVSRFKRSSLPKSFGVLGLVGAGAMAGRLVADTKISCKELIRLRKYDITEFAKIILRENREEFTPEHAACMFDTSQKLLYSIHHTLNDANFNLRVMFELMAIPLSHQITKLCGNVWQRTMLGGRAERNEYLLLHAFTREGFIVPEKRTAKMKAAEQEGAENKKKDTYSGGLVLEPKKGYYDTFILLLDFNSLYPSIIQEYNICFTTVDTSTTDSEGFADIPSSDVKMGILPVEIKKLVERRKDVKGLLKNVQPGTDKYQQYDIRQKALKLTANSMYGCLGFSNSRFYAKALAALVTSKGREALLSAKNLVEGSLRLEVIYGDTDSIMINTHSTDIPEVMEMGKRVKMEVNKMYRLLEIDIDGMYKSMLLLKKKKYAAISLHVNADGSGFREEKELKGLDIVRRDWCDLAKDAGNFVLDCILSTKKRDDVLEEIHGYLTGTGTIFVHLLFYLLTRSANPIYSLPDIGVKVKDGSVAVQNESGQNQNWTSLLEVWRW
eukprot:sb/3461188/